MTAPTNPTPITTTTSFPSARAAFARPSSRFISAAYSSRVGRGNDSPAGLTDFSAMDLSPGVWCADLVQTKPRLLTSFAKRPQWYPQEDSPSARDFVDSRTGDPGKDRGKRPIGRAPTPRPQGSHHAPL